MEEDNQKHGRAHAFQRLGRLRDYREGGESALGSQPLSLGCQTQFQEPKEVGRQRWGRARHARIPSILSLHKGRDVWGKGSSCYSQTVHRTTKGRNSRANSPKDTITGKGLLGSRRPLGPFPPYPGCLWPGASEPRGPLSESRPRLSYRPTSPSLNKQSVNSN